MKWDRLGLACIGVAFVTALTAAWIAIGILLINPLPTPHVTEGLPQLMYWGFGWIPFAFIGAIGFSIYED